MQSSNRDPQQKSIISQPLSTIIAASLGSSIAIHSIAIAGINHFWQPAIDLDDPIEIMLVKPVEIAKVPAVPPPVIPKSIKPNLTPSITSVKLRSKPISTPTPVKLTPKLIQPSIQKRVPPNPISIPKPIVIKSTAKPKSIASKPTPTSTPIANSNPLFPPEPSTINPRPITTKTAHLPQTISTSQPVKRTIPKQIEAIRSNPQPIETNQSDGDLTTPRDRATRLGNPFDFKTGDRQAQQVKQPFESSSSSHHLGQNIPNNQNAVGGSSSNSSSSSSGNKYNSLPQSSSNTGENSTGNSSTSIPSGNMPKSGSAHVKLECIKYCEIPRLRDLQDADGGKNRLRIRIVIDANGSVIDASIAKSSDNSDIDSAVLIGVKQMQFSPSGKEIRGIIKANILIRSTNPSMILSVT